MLNDPARRVITSGHFAHLTTLNADGSPHVSLAWTGIEDDEIVIGTLGDQTKLRNMRRDPRVALTWETEVTNQWGLREYLIVYGSARITEGGAPELLQKLAHVYLGPDVTFPPMPNPPAGFVTRISAERLGGMGPWTAP